MKSKREKFLKKTMEKMTETLRSRDLFLARANRVIDELNEVINILGERLEEMFRLYTPDLEVKSREQYAQMVTILEKEDTSAKELSKIFGSAKANEIIKKADLKEMNDEDFWKCKELASEILRLYKMREDFEAYEEKVCEEVCPNLAYLGGAHLAGKMIAHVGSLKRLALLPASTIQVIGAEKALFKHLKNKRVKPPKHGLIFQHSQISTAPKRIRGRLSRTLAAKLSSAAKADAFTHNFIAKELKEQFEERYQKLIKEKKKVNKQ